MSKFSSAAEVLKYLNISPQKLAYWRKTQKINFTKVANKTYLYDLSPFKQDFADDNKKKHILYARVSNTKQSDDLKRQVDLLRTFTAANGVIPDDTITDIGSGMNETRPGFKQLLTLILNKEVDSVYVTYKDRLTRFGFGYLEEIFSLLGTRLVVINATAEEDFQTELTQDLISIIHHFGMKLYSNRRKALKTLAKELISEEKDK